MKIKRETDMRYVEEGKCNRSLRNANPQSFTVNCKIPVTQITHPKS